MSPSSNIFSAEALHGNNILTILALLTVGLQEKYLFVYSDLLQSELNGIKNR